MLIKTLLGVPILAGAIGLSSGVIQGKLSPTNAILSQACSSVNGVLEGGECFVTSTEGVVVYVPSDDNTCRIIPILDTSQKSYEFSSPNSCTKELILLARRQIDALRIKSTI